MKHRTQQHDKRQPEAPRGPERGRLGGEAKGLTKGNNGGQVSISPPANVKSGVYDCGEVLASGIDTLYLSLHVVWQGDLFFEHLHALKNEAKNEEKPQPCVLEVGPNGTLWGAVVQPYGSRGYEWLIESRDFGLSIGNWMEPISRPGIKVELRSEFLWRLGAAEAVEAVLGLLRRTGAEVQSAMVSRADLCVDILLPQEAWGEEIRQNIVCRARHISPHFENGILTGISIGRGVILARLYDKPREILMKSKKEWMYDIWRIKDVPEGYRIIRVEFQLRREVLKQLGIDSFLDLQQHLDHVWAHCTKKWLRLEDRPGKHHTQRTLLGWWGEVQEGFVGVQGAEPAVRVKAVSVDRRQLLKQISGLSESYVALEYSPDWRPSFEGGDIEVIFQGIARQLKKTGMGGATFIENVQRKRAKYRRMILKEHEGLRQRVELGMSSEDREDMP